MSHFRQDPISGQWVIIAPDRATRPIELQGSRPQNSDSDCPFCRGSESTTPPAVLYLGESEENWRVRIIPNLYPALSPEEDSSIPSSSDLFPVRQGEGKHEVIVESPEHHTRFTELSDTQAGLVFSAYRQRICELGAINRFQYALLFKNSGHEGGASLEHVHSQLLAMEFVPDLPRRKLRNATDYYQRQGNCIFCDLISAEQQSEERIVAQTAGLIAFCPFASLWSYNVWVLPRSHESRFHNAETGMLTETALLVRNLLAALEKITGTSDYNFVLHSSPFGTNQYDQYHWHIEIFPRLTKTAGWEWGTHCFINPVPPEEAAQSLREAFKIPIP